MTRRGAYAAISYMACAGKLRSLQFDTLFVPIKIQVLRDENQISRSSKKIGSCCMP
ncbi:hypothetical protein GBA52_001046 [Prunus armeniaca]|nr:hypothetical protein GBA52_001046 [Prunus armeniaca]